MKGFILLVISSLVISITGCFQSSSSTSGAVADFDALSYTITLAEGQEAETDTLPIRFHLKLGSKLTPDSFSAENISNIGSARFTKVSIVPNGDNTFEIRIASIDGYGSIQIDPGDLTNRNGGKIKAYSTPEIVNYIPPSYSNSINKVKSFPRKPSSTISVFKIFQTEPMLFVTHSEGSFLMDGNLENAVSNNQISYIEPLVSEQYITSYDNDAVLFHNGKIWHINRSGNVNLVLEELGDGSKIQQLETNSPQNSYFHHHDSSIYFFAHNSDDKYYFYSYNLNEKSLKELAEMGTYSLYSKTPQIYGITNSKIIFSDFEGSSAYLWVSNLDGSNRRKLLNGAASNNQINMKNTGFYYRSGFDLDNGDLLILLDLVDTNKQHYIATDGTDAGTYFYANSATGNPSYVDQYFIRGMYDGSHGEWIKDYAGNWVIARANGFATLDQSSETFTTQWTLTNPRYTRKFIDTNSSTFFVFNSATRSVFEINKADYSTLHTMTNERYFLDAVYYDSKVFYISYNSSSVKKLYTLKDGASSLADHVDSDGNNIGEVHNSYLIGNQLYILADVDGGRKKTLFRYNESNKFESVYNSDKKITDIEQIIFSGDSIYTLGSDQYVNHDLYKTNLSTLDYFSYISFVDKYYETKSSILYDNGSFLLSSIAHGYSGAEFWTIDGANANMITELIPGNAGVGLTCGGINDKLICNDYSNDVWVTNGTPGGSSSIFRQDRAIEPMSIEVFPEEKYSFFYEWNGFLYFMFIKESTASWGTDPVRSDGTSVEPIGPSDWDTDYYALMAHNNTHSFWSDYKDGPIITDGTSASAVKIYEATNLSEFVYEVFFHNGLWYFTADNTDYDKKLWTSDGSIAGTQILNDYNVGADDSVSLIGPTHGSKALILLDKLGGLGRELYLTDGTASGTTLLKDTNPSGDAASSARHILSSSSYTLFYLYSGTSKGIWVTDNTEAGTQILSTRQYISKFETTNQTFLVEKDSSAKLYYVSVFNHSTGNYHILKSFPVNTRAFYYDDGTPEEEYYDYPPKSFFSTASYVYFVAHTDEYGSELWQSDGTPSGTSVFVESITGSKSQYALEEDGIMPTAFKNSYFYFWGFSAAEGNSLFRIHIPE